MDYFSYKAVNLLKKCREDNCDNHRLYLQGKQFTQKMLLVQISFLLDDQSNLTLFRNTILK